MSMNTMNSKRSITSRRSVKISLDNFNEDNLQPPFLTSPRSLHACKKEGVLPEELVHRPPSCYDNKDKNLPPRVVELRYQTANNARKQRLKIVMEAYKKLCEEGHHDHKYGNNGSATNRSVSSNGEEEKKLIEKVMKEMEFQKMKQKEEVETMLLLEIRAQRIQQKAAAKAAEQAERAAELAAAKALKDAEWQEHKAAMEAKKRQDEIDAAILAKKLAEERLQQVSVSGAWISLSLFLSLSLSLSLPLSLSLSLFLSSLPRNASNRIWPREPGRRNEKKSSRKCRRT